MNVETCTDEIRSMRQSTRTRLSLDFYHKHTATHHHHYHVTDKLAVTVHRCLRHRAPRYLADYCVPVPEVPGRQHLRSTRSHQLSVPRVRRSIFVTRAFSVAGPTVWNSLPDHLRDPAVDSEQFRRGLKKYILFAGHSNR